MKKYIKKMLYIIIAIVATLILTYILFTSFYPSFGGDISKEEKLSYEASKQYKNGTFQNVKADVPKRMAFSETLKIGWKFFTSKVPNGRPKEDLKPQEIDSLQIANYRGDTRLVWFGHSSFLLQMNNKTILLDPMFGKVAAPHQWLGENRFNKDFPIPVEQLPKIDAVIFSHDHYDHLDYGTVMKIKNKTKHFFVPLGVGTHLVS